VMFRLSRLVRFGIMVKVVPAFQDFYGTFRAERPLATLRGADGTRVAGTAALGRAAWLRRLTIIGLHL